MNIRFWSCLALSLLVVLGCLYLSWAPQTTFPFDLLPAPGSPTQAIVTPTTGVPLPPGLQAGDIVDFSSMAVRDRLAITNSNSPPPGDILNLTVLRGGRSLNIPVAFVVIHRSGEGLVDHLTSLALTWLFAALGLLLLWRGQRQAAWAVCLWCLVNVLQPVGSALPLHEPWSGLISIVSYRLSADGSLLALYLLADDLTRAGITAGTRRFMRLLFGVFFTCYAAGNPVYTYLSIVKELNFPYTQTVLISTHLAAFAVPLALLALCYRRAPAAERIRIRWVWASMLMYVGSYLVSLTPSFLPLDNLQFDLLSNALAALAFLGFTYAVLRHRLVSLRLVLNRTLVYGVITSLVVGVFAALTSLIDHFAVGRTEGALLQLLVPLSLGVTLNLIKKRLDGFVERLFFQRQYRAETALTRLIRECGFIEDRDALLDRTVDEVLQYLKPTGLALYERTESGYARVRQQGERSFPARLTRDDGAMVSLRSSLAEADLDTLTSALGKEGLAFPLAVRGTLMGALILGQRPAEHYTQAERALLANLGQQVAAALNALRAREAENFVDAVARGAITSYPEAQTQAQRLLSSAA